MRLELSRVGLLVKLANRYTTKGVLDKYQTFVGVSITQCFIKGEFIIHYFMTGESIIFYFMIEESIINYFDRRVYHI